MSMTILLALLSYGFHLLNLQVFIFRRLDPKRYRHWAVCSRSVALLTLLLLYWPFLGGGIKLIALAPLALGVFLQLTAVRALGLERTYYGVELGALASRRVSTFPYSAVPHPMHLGIILQCLGLYLLSPEFNVAYPWLIPGHLLFTVLTALVEHLDLHVPPGHFRFHQVRFQESAEVQAVDRLRDWALAHFRGHIHQECSMHRYIKTLPDDIIPDIDRLRYAPQIMQVIQAQYPDSQIIPLAMTDELYISRYNYDRGGDQGLFDRHYDGNLRAVPGMSVVRSLIYLSSEDDLEVVFHTSGQRAKMRSYDVGLLDFHRELHWVEGQYQADSVPRVLLKCNYYVSHGEWWPLRQLNLGLNIGVFYVVKAAMEYSKSPKTLPQKAIGFVCNLFRRLNIINPALPVLLIFALVLTVFMV